MTAAGARQVVVVGGGMLGLTLALRLQAQGHRVTVLERANALGGMAAADMIGDQVWDRFYHVILASDRHLRGLLGEIGLGDAMQFGITRTGLHIDGQLRSLSTTLEYLRFPGLSLLDKARLAWTIVHGGRVTDVAALEQVPVLDWLRRHSGDRVTERLWLPLLRSKLGSATDLASAVFIQASIARLAAARQAGLQREEFGYVQGGYATILRQFAAHLEARGVRLVTGAAAEQVIEGPHGVEVRLADGRLIDGDLAVLTTPCHQVAALCPQLSAEEQARLARVQYQGIVCASLLLRAPLSPFYITNLATPGPWPFTGVIEMTALVPPSTFGGRSLVYLPRYAAPGDAVWSMDDRSIEATMLDGLSRLHPTFDRRSVEAFRVHRVRDVFAVPTLDYSRQACPPVATSLARVALVNAAQITDGTLNVNETVALADRQVPVLHGLLARLPQAAPVVAA